MADLSQKGVHKFWSEFPDNTIYRVVTFMDGVETWPVDGDPQFESAMQTLASKLEEVGTTDLNEENKLIRLCCYLKESRALRLLHSIDMDNPGAASKLLMYAEEKANEGSNNSDFTLFLRRNIVFERLRLLSRVFAPQRFQLILKALEEEDE